jgi:hypothetical protein
VVIGISVLSCVACFGQVVLAYVMCGHRRRFLIACTCKALQKYMHEFHADRDHAMCNIQNRSIPAVQLTQLRKLVFQVTGVLKSSQSCQVLQCKVAARQWGCLAEIVSFSGSCSRCLVLNPLPCPEIMVFRSHPNGACCMLSGRL